MKEMFAECGENCYIKLPFRANWCGKNLHFGNNVYANFNLTVVDDGDIYVDDKVMFGPNVTIATANQPIEPGLRENAMQYNKPVHICENVVAVRNPCRVLREIGEHDKEYFYKNKKSTGKILFNTVFHNSRKHIINGAAHFFLKIFFYFQYSLPSV